MHSKLIAPCGMNCSLCYAYLREKNKCPGCRFLSKDIPVSISQCKIRNCRIIKNHNGKFCSTKCKDFPCEKLQKLDKRYKTKYSTSMIDNLNEIENIGVKKFVINQKKKYINGNKIFCIHKKKYFLIEKNKDGKI